jgi:hypothetical protein
VIARRQGIVHRLATANPKIARRMARAPGVVVMLVLTMVRRHPRKQDLVAAATAIRPILLVRPMAPPAADSASSPKQKAAAASAADSAWVVCRECPGRWA